MLTLVSSFASGIGRTWTHPLVHGQSLQPQKEELKKQVPATLVAETVRGMVMPRSRPLRSPASSSPLRVTSATAVKIYFSSRYFKVLLEFLESRSLVSPWNYSPAVIFRSTRRACLQSCCCTKLWVPVNRATWLCVRFSSIEGFPGQFLHMVLGSRWDSGLT